MALLASGFDPLGAFMMTIAVNARHIFYGISMLHQYQGMGRLKPSLIFSLTDESFSILCSAKVPDHVEKAPYAFPEAISILVIILLYVWKKNTLLSIGVGALLYMFLIQTI